MRLGGLGALEGGATLIWSVAEGGRGRRWRFVRTERDGTSLSVLLEVSMEGRPTRLEAASAAGLLTLHPEPDERSAHGNVVRSDGIDHLAFPWSRSHRFAVEGLPWVASVAWGCVGDSGRAGEWPSLHVDLDLAVRPADVPAGPLDRDGVPPDLAHGAWPLE